MTNQRRSRSVVEGPVSRRKFLARTAAAAIGLAIVPRRVLGGAGYVPPSDKINIAFIGVGAQGLRVMLHFLREPDVQAVAVCDVNKTGANYPQWDTHEFCNSVRKLLGVDSGWDWLSPDQPIQLSHSLAGHQRCCGPRTLPENRRRLTTARSSAPARDHGCSAYRTSANYLRSRKTWMPLLCALPTTCTQPCRLRR